jgi:hypothetical protein
MYHFGGPPSRTLNITDAQLVQVYDRLVEGATWTFVNGVRDADTRHLLLAAEWARSYRPETIGALGEGSLESARAAYSAYVKAGSKETLKALADLRKTVSEESQKASQRAQDLSSALWKDLAVATAPFVLKILPDASKTSSLWIAGALAVGAASFLIFSFSIQVFLNHRYLHAQKRARELWRGRLNLVLTQSEVEEFSERPIQESVRDYRIVRLWVGGVYTILVAILFIFAVLELKSAVAGPGPIPNATVAPPTPTVGTTTLPSPGATRPTKGP